jgi:hypothetical protein
VRTTCVRSIAHEQPNWVVQPLVEAGLTAEEIRVLLVRLCFDAMVQAGPVTLADAMAPVRDRPAEVRAAWAETIDRLVRLGDTGA